MTRTLSCGPARLVLEGDRLRHLHLDEVEAIRGLSFLVRDRDWGTVAPRIDDLRLSDEPDGPRITWTARYDMGTGSVRAALTVDLTPDGLTARAVIGAEGQVWTNRTGFTLLHPITGVAGAPVTVDHAGGPPEQALTRRNLEVAYGLGSLHGDEDPDTELPEVLPDPVHGLHDDPSDPTAR